MMKITWKSNLILDDNLPLNKTLKTCNMVIVVRSVFCKGSKCYPEFLDECLHKFTKE